MSFAKDGQDEGESGNAGWPSNANGVVAIGGVLKDQIGCKLDDNNEPYNCSKDSGIDNTLDIGTFDGQPPVILLAGLTDSVTPYVNSKAIYDRAQDFNIPSALISMLFMETYFGIINQTNQEMINSH